MSKQAKKGPCSWTDGSTAGEADARPCWGIYIINAHLQSPPRWSGPTCTASTGLSVSYRLNQEIWTGFCLFIPTVRPGESTAEWVLRAEVPSPRSDTRGPVTALEGLRPSSPHVAAAASPPTSCPRSLSGARDTTLSLDTHTHAVPVHPDGTATAWRRSCVE